MTTLSFLAASADEPLHPAFVLLLLYGLRRGEVLGLRWSDIDGDTIHVRQQVQRIKGQLHFGPVKTRAGSRDLPLIGLAKDALNRPPSNSGNRPRSHWPRLGRYRAGVHDQNGQAGRTT